VATFILQVVEPSSVRSPQELHLYRYDFKLGKNG
jgi:hypothetical protein